MKVTVGEIKYFNHINEMVDINAFIPFVNYLLSIKSKRYLCYLSIDNYNNLKKTLSDKELDNVKLSISNALLNNEIVEVVANYEDGKYIYIAKDDFEAIRKPVSEIKKLAENNITASIGIVDLDSGNSFDELLELVVKNAEQAFSKGGNCIVITKKEEFQDGNMVVPHLVCRYCRKITNNYRIENNVLTLDGILADSNYRKIRIYRCNKCHIASLNLREPIEFDHSILESSDYQNILNKDIPDQEKNILLAVIIYLSVKDYLSAGMLMYFHYEITKKANSKNYVMEYLQSSETIDALILLLDFIRKYDSEKIFRRLIKYIHPVSRYHRMLINLEEYKMNNKDFGDLNYHDDISYKHFFKDEKNEHDNLTDIALFSGDNIEKIHPLFSLSEEYVLLAALTYNQEHYCIYVIPYIGLTRIYKVNIIDDYKIELVEDKSLFDSIIDEYNKQKNNPTKECIKPKHKKMYFEDAMVAQENRDEKKCREYLRKGIVEDEVYSYYLADELSISIDTERFEELKNEDNPYALAVKGMEMLDVDDNLGVTMLESSDCGVAKYNLYRHFYEIDEEEIAVKYLEQSLKYDFPLAYKEIAKEMWLNDRYIPLKDIDYIKICDKAIEYGFIAGYYAKAHLYEEGHFVEKDLNKAIEVYKLLPDSEYTSKMSRIIKHYYSLGDYENVYNLSLEYLKNENTYGCMAYYYLGDVYKEKSFSKYDLIKSLIFKKSTITSNQCESTVIEIAHIYYEEFANRYMASKYVKFFDFLVNYNDTCLSNFDDYLEMVYELEDYEEDNIDETDYYSLGRKELSNNNYQKSYDAFIRGFMLDDKRCFRALIKFYLEGIVVEKDISAVKALNRASYNDLIFDPITDDEDMDDFMENLDYFTLKSSVEMADNLYFDALDENNKEEKLRLLNEALSAYEDAIYDGADNVSDRMNGIKKMIEGLE